VSFLSGRLTPYSDARAVGQISCRGIRTSQDAQSWPASTFADEVVE
jgi:hypothetical protein